MKTTKPITIKEVAKLLNVAPSTVSRALQDHPSIGLTTTLRVKKIVNELNYKPDLRAISFKQKKSLTIGVILPHLSIPFYATALAGIEEFAMQKNYNVIVGQSLESLDRQQKVLEGMHNQRVDGLVVCISKNVGTYNQFTQLQQNGIPMVFFNRVPALKNTLFVSCNIRKELDEVPYHQGYKSAEVLFKLIAGDQL